MRLRELLSWMSLRRLLHKVMIMKWKAKVVVRLKEGLNDPEGRVIGKALKNLGYKIGELRVPKYFELTFESENPEKDVEDMCRRLLANPVIHTYSYEIERLGE